MGPRRHANEEGGWQKVVGWHSPRWGCTCGYADNFGFRMACFRCGLAAPWASRQRAADNKGSKGGDKATLHGA
eukprot:6165747-Prorocentrum_lima.AAC.1